VADRLHRLPNLHLPLAASPRERRRSIVILAHEHTEMHEHVVAPDPVIGILDRPGVRVREINTDAAVDIGQDLSCPLVKAQTPRRTTIALTLNVLKQIEDARRPGVSHPANRPTYSNRLRLGASVKRDLRLTHVAECRAGCLFQQDSRSQR